VYKSHSVKASIRQAAYFKIPKECQKVIDILQRFAVDGRKEYDRRICYLEFQPKAKLRFI